MCKLKINNYLLISKNAFRAILYFEFSTSGKSTTMDELIVKKLGDELWIFHFSIHFFCSFAKLNLQRGFLTIKCLLGKDERKICNKNN